jgi:hypothetical protein
MSTPLAQLIASQVIPPADPAHTEAVRRLVEYQRQTPPSALSVLREDIRVAVVVNALRRQQVPAIHQQAHFTLGFMTQPHLHAIRIGRDLFGLMEETSWLSLADTRVKSLPIGNSHKDREIKPIKSHYDLYDQLARGPRGAALEDASNALLAWMHSVELNQNTMTAAPGVRPHRL